MTWLTVTECLCHTWSRIFSVCRSQIPPFLRWWHYRIWLIFGLSHMRYKKGATSGAGTPHPSGRPAITGFSGFRFTLCIVIRILSCEPLLVFSSVFFWHALFLRHRFMVYHYPFGIFKNVFEQTIRSNNVLDVDLKYNMISPKHPMYRSLVHKHYLLSNTFRYRYVKAL
jgi:hypothetical protein